VSAPATPGRDALTFRRATAADAAAYSALARQLATDTFAQHNDPDDFALYLRETYGVARQAAEIAGPDSVVLLAELEGEIAGYAYLKRGRPPACVTGASPVEISRFYVAGRWHGRGVAQALMRRTAEEAREWGARTVWLGVWEQNHRGRAFYAKCGYEEVGSHVFMLGTDAQRDLVMVAGVDALLGEAAHPPRPAR
jgi:diamine N-acetyltransferase